MNDLLPPGTRVYQPTELNREARVHLEAGFPRVWVQGELSNLSRPASGHVYFSLKDAGAQLRCALFRGNARGLKTTLANGQEVVAAGRLSLFEPRGDYQLIVDRLLDAGLGDLQQAIEALKKKLAAEGLLDPARKRALPTFPQRISVVSSATGAALRDVLHVLARRWPLARVRLYPTLVQGEQAAPALVRALNAAGRHGFGQVVILARGGGSLEDLWAFNEETVARAIAVCPVPVVSAVGHETDFTIADFVADVRAPTPSAAAELVTPDRVEIQGRVIQCENRLRRVGEARLNQAGQALDFAHRRLLGQHPQRRLARLAEMLSALEKRLRRKPGLWLALGEQRLAGLSRRLRARHPADRVRRAGEALHRAEDRLRRAGRQGVQQSEARLAAAARALHTVSPLQVLARGYAVVESADGRVLARREDFKADQAVSLRLADFRVPARITGSAQDLPPE